VRPALHTVKYRLLLGIVRGDLALHPQREHKLGVGVSGISFADIKGATETAWKWKKAKRQTGFILLTALHK
jgi:hypothetical protein